MRNKKKMIACGMMAGLMLTGVVVSAAEPEMKAASDCVPTLNLYRTYGVYQVFETTSPMNPNTPKRITGEYKSRDINGNTDTQHVAESLNVGQISVRKDAPNHYQSYTGWMEYFLNGRYAGKLEKKY